MITNPISNSNNDTMNLALNKHSGVTSAGKEYASYTAIRVDLLLLIFYCSKPKNDIGYGIAL